MVAGLFGTAIFGIPRLLRTLPLWAGAHLSSDFWAVKRVFSCANSTILQWFDGLVLFCARNSILRRLIFAQAFDSTLLQ